MEKIPRCSRSFSIEQEERNMNTNLAYQDAFREELINGEVVAMSPAASNHNRIARNILLIFGSYLDGKKCEPFGDGEIVYLTEKDHFIPDFMVVCDPEKIQPDGVHGAPDLVVEVLSPGTAKIDKTHKKDVYAKCGVQEYWLVNPADKSVEVYRLDGAEFVLDNLYIIHPKWMLAKMSPVKRAAAVTHFKCSLFDDLEISLEDIFYRTI